MCVIYLDDKSIILTNVRENIGTNKFFELKDISFEVILSELSRKDVDTLYLFHPKKGKLLKKFKKLIPTIKAGGGIVRNKKSQILIMNRRGKWDFPKGKKEKGENIATCALREVEEETGVKKLLIDRYRTTTYHIFKRDGQYFLKETVWYDMHTSFKKKPVPQTEEDIEKVCWKDEEEVKLLIKDSYKNIQQIFVEETPNQ